MNLVNSMQESTPSSNLSELKKLSAYLTETEPALSAFWQLSPNCLCIAKAGQFVKVNPAWTKVLGYQPEELLGRPYKDFVHDDDKAKTILIEEALSSNHKVLCFHNRYKHKTEDRWVIIEWYAYEDEHTGLVYATGLDKTIEVRKLESLKTALMMAPIGMFLADSQGECVFVNYKWQELSGLSLEESLGGGWINGLCDEFQETIKKEWYSFIERVKVNVNETFKTESCFHNRRTGVTTMARVQAYFFHGDTTIAYIDIQPILD